MRKDLSHHLRCGNPWVFREALDGNYDGAAGEVVDILDIKGVFIARGYYDAKSDIAFRTLTLNRSETINAEFFQKRIESAFSIRKKFIDSSQTSAFRLIHGEGDYLPGIVCDIYNTTAVLRFDCEGARAFLSDVVQSIQTLTDAECVYEKRGDEGEALFGRLPTGDLTILENGLKFGVNIREGQKTGFFIDQRENRRAVAKYCKGRRVLNCFAYTGGFSIYADRAGASEVVSVEIGQSALEQVKKNLELNGMSADKHRFECRDVFDFLRKEASKKRAYDLIILDPPALARKKKALPRAEKAYLDMNKLALKLLAPGGVLVSCSCTARLGKDKFIRIIRDASVEVKRRLRIVEIGRQPPDHPIIPGLPEAEYLKCVISVAE